MSPSFEKIGVEAIVKGYDDFQSKLGRMGSSVAGFGTSAAKVAVAGIATLGTAAAGLGAAFGKLAIDAAPIQGISAAFEGMASTVEGGADQMLKALQQASMGTVSNTELMRQWNTAAQLVSVSFAEQLPGAMTYLGKISAATGQDLDFLLSSLTTGIGRLSPMILDNLSIQVDLNSAYEEWADANGVAVEEMTKTEQQMALMDQVMTKLAANTASMPDITENASTKMAQLKTSFQNAKDEIGVAFLPVFTQVLDAVSKFTSEILPPLVQWLSDNVPKAVAQVSSAFSGSLPSIQSVRNFIANTLIPTLQNIIKTAIQIWEQIRPTVQKIADFFIQMMEKIVKFVQDNWPLISEAISDTMGTIQTIVETVLPIVKAIIESTLTVIMSLVKAALQIISGDWEGAWETIKQLVSDALNAIVDFVIAIGPKLFAAGKAIIRELKRGLEGALNEVTDWFGDKLKDITDLLPFSEPKDVSSPLYGLKDAGRAIIENILEGLKDAVPDMMAVMDEALQGLFKLAKGFGSAGSFFATIFKERTLDPIEAEIKTLDDQIKELQKRRDAGGLNPMESRILYGELAMLEERRAQAAERYAEEQQRVLELQENMQTLRFLEEQFKLLELIRQYGLDPGSILGDLTLGTGASYSGLIDAMARATASIIPQIQQQLTQPLLASGSTMGSQQQVTVNISGTTINNGMDLAAFETRVLDVVRRSLR